MSKHTPGPWAAGRQGDVDTGEPLPWLSVCERGREEVICEVKREADARLIAAAPDLLAVCSDLVEMSDAGVPCPPRLVVMARLAVEKARGEP